MSSAPPHILEKMNQGQVAYILGAGASACARREQWKGPDSNCLPTAAELARYLAKQFNLRGTRDLATVCSLIDRKQLKDLLDRTFGRKLEPSGLHQFIASQPKNQLVITTNYDSMMEAAFDRAKKSYLLVAYSGTSRTWERGKSLWVRSPTGREYRASPDEVVLDPGQSSVVFKVHGSPEVGYVISEEDYFDLLADIGRGMVFPVSLIRYLHNRHLLVLGYRLEDWSLRILMRVFQPPKRLRGFARRESWQFLERLPKWHSKLWEQRGVRAYCMKLEDFVGERTE